MARIFILIVAGAAIGVGIGLVVGWDFAPVQYVNSHLSDLDPRYKDDYTVMVAAAYQVDGDLNEAIRRLQGLGASNIPVYVRDVTERYISESGSGNENDIRTLVVLSRALGYYTPPMQSFTLPTAVPTPGS
ncbi:MAG TPA: hypothetical protein VKQ72_06865 [Aggregatilineales bacterium]|nr:hypothetical protein [Aggregatilineales bacterium]